jgi:hypothetical protein
MLHGCMLHVACCMLHVACCTGACCTGACCTGACCTGACCMLQGCMLHGCMLHAARVHAARVHVARVHVACCISSVARCSGARYTAVPVKVGPVQRAAVVVDAAAHQRSMHGLAHSVRVVVAAIEARRSARTLFVGAHIHAACRQTRTRNRVRRTGTHYTTPHARTLARARTHNHTHTHTHTCTHRQLPPSDGHGCLQSSHFTFCMSSSAVQSEMKKPSNPLRALPPIARRMPLPSAAARSATQKPLGGVKARSAGEGPLPAQYTRILAQMARAPPARIAGALTTARGRGRC